MELREIKGRELVLAVTDYHHVSFFVSKEERALLRL